VEEDETNKVKGDRVEKLEDRTRRYRRRREKTGENEEEM
jgi:hypothetical protein